MKITELITYIKKNNVLQVLEIVNMGIRCMI